MTPRQQWEAEIKAMEKQIAVAQRRLAAAMSRQLDDAVLQGLEGELDTAREQLLRHQALMPGTG